MKGCKMIRGKGAIRICCCGKEVLNHIVKEGSHIHVIYWDSNGPHCSEPKCEKNHICKGKYDGNLTRNK